MHYSIQFTEKGPLLIIIPTCTVCGVGCSCPTMYNVPYTTISISHDWTMAWSWAVLLLIVYSMSTAHISWSFGGLSLPALLSVECGLQFFSYCLKWKLAVATVSRIGMLLIHVQVYSPFACVCVCVSHTIGVKLKLVWGTNLMVYHMGQSSYCSRLQLLVVKVPTTAHS